MAPFVPRALRSARQLASALKNSANDASDSTDFTGNHSASACTSILDAFDPQMAAALLAAGPSSVAYRLSTGNTFGSTLRLAQAIAEEERTTAAPVSTEAPSFYALEASADAVTSTSSLAGSDSFLSSSSAASFPAKLSDEHLASTFGYNLDKVIDLTPSSSVTSLSSLGSSVESKAGKAKKVGAAFVSRWRKLGHSARELTKLSSSKSTSSVDSDSKSVAQAKASSASSSASSLLFDFGRQCDAVQLVPPPRSDSLPVELNLAPAALDESETGLESVCSGDEDPFEYEHYLDNNNSRSASPDPAIELLSMDYFAPIDAVVAVSSSSSDDETPLAQLKFNRLLALTASAPGAGTVIIFESSLVGLGISWEEGPDYQGEVGMIEVVGAGAGEAKSARRGSRVWFS